MLERGGGVTTNPRRGGVTTNAKRGGGGVTANVTQW
jgi:hypothetical protein